MDEILFKNIQELIIKAQNNGYESFKLANIYLRINEFDNALKWYKHGESLHDENSKLGNFIIHLKKHINDETGLEYPFDDAEFKKFMIYYANNGYPLARFLLNVYKYYYETLTPLELDEIYNDAECYNFFDGYAIYDNFLFKYKRDNGKDYFFTLRLPNSIKGIKRGADNYNEACILAVYEYYKADYPEFNYTPVEMLKILARGAIKGNPKLAKIVARIFEFGGYHIKKDLGKAIAYYNLAADDNDGEACYYYAMYAASAGDYEEARKYYKKGLELGHGPCGTMLGDMYENGIGVEKNIAYAKMIYSYEKNYCGIDDMLRLEYIETGDEGLYDALYGSAKLLKHNSFRFVIEKEAKKPDFYLKTFADLVLMDGTELLGFEDLFLARFLADTFLKYHPYPDDDEKYLLYQLYAVAYGANGDESDLAKLKKIEALLPSSYRRITDFFFFTHPLAKDKTL